MTSKGRIISFDLSPAFSKFVLFIKSFENSYSLAKQLMFLLEPKWTYAKYSNGAVRFIALTQL